MHIGRRGFIAFGAAAIAAGAALVFRALGGPPVQALTAAEKKACALTVGATEGPFHVTGIAELAAGNLNTSNLPGTPLEVSGRVFLGLDDTKPAAGAEVEIWHCDSDGAYHPNGNGPTANYKEGEVALRGFVKADAEGRYRFATIYPGEYTGRTRHFHFKVRAPGKPEFTTQLIVPARPGDTLTFDTDDIAEGLPNCQLLVVDETTAPAKANFDFRLPAA
jgi:protocatechuate 3,4-dioxygenase beta subunit